MRILLTGSSGQVGSALLHTLPWLGEVIGIARPQLDLTKPDPIRRAVREARPDVIVTPPPTPPSTRRNGNKRSRMAVNRDAPVILAEEAVRRFALLVHFSTDYAFDGQKSSPYMETATNPLNAYSRSKFAGELASQALGMPSPHPSYELVYANTGNNFPLKRRSCALWTTSTARPLGTECSQTPPAAITAVLRDSSLEALYHMTASGSTSWYGFARAILGDCVTVLPISSSKYPTPARRPRNSVLNNWKLARNLNIHLPSWEVGLREVLGLVAS